MRQCQEAEDNDEAVPRGFVGTIFEKDDLSSVDNGSKWTVASIERLTGIHTALGTTFKCLDVSTDEVGGAMIRKAAVLWYCQEKGDSTELQIGFEGNSKKESVLKAG